MTEQPDASERSYDESADQMAAGLTPPVETQPASHEDLTRRGITYGLMGLLAFVTVAAVMTMWFHRAPAADMNELLDRLFTPLATLAGTALGFYFGDRRSK